MSLRAVHNRLVEEYGIPQWGSYVLFALATILLGALLGVLIVCMIDLLFPARPEPRATALSTSSSEPIASSSKKEDQDEEGVRRRKAKEGEDGDESGAADESKKDS